MDSVSESNSDVGDSGAETVRTVANGGRGATVASGGGAHRLRLEFNLSWEIHHGRGRGDDEGEGAMGDTMVGDGTMRRQRHRSDGQHRRGGHTVSITVKHVAPSHTGSYMTHRVLERLYWWASKPSMSSPPCTRTLDSALFSELDSAAFRGVQRSALTLASRHAHHPCRRNRTDGSYGSKGAGVSALELLTMSRRRGWVLGEAAWHGEQSTQLHFCRQLY
jgi:hypothetical protein